MGYFVNCGINQWEVISINISLRGFVQTLLWIASLGYHGFKKLGRQQVLFFLRKNWVSFASLIETNCSVIHSKVVVRIGRMELLTVTVGQGVVFSTTRQCPCSRAYFKNEKYSIMLFEVGHSISAPTCFIEQKAVGGHLESVTP